MNAALVFFLGVVSGAGLAVLMIRLYIAGIVAVDRENDEMWEAANKEGADVPRR